MDNNKINMFKNFSESHSLMFKCINSYESFFVVENRVVWLKAGQPHLVGLINEDYQVYWRDEEEDSIPDDTGIVKIPVIIKTKWTEHYTGGHNTNDRLGTSVGVEMPYAPGSFHPLWWGKTFYGSFTGASSKRTSLEWPWYQYHEATKNGVVETPFRTPNGSKIAYVKRGGINPWWVPLVFEGDFMRPRDYIHPKFLNIWFRGKPSIEKIIKLLSSDSNLITE